MRNAFSSSFWTQCSRSFSTSTSGWARSGSGSRPRSGTTPRSGSGSGSRPNQKHLGGVPTRAPLSEASGKNFPSQGKSFDRYFVAPEVRKKAWDGQDKDTYFRDKYAHVHAQQRKEREERKKTSPYKAARSFTKNKIGRMERAEKLGLTPKKEPNILLQKKQAEADEANENIRRNFSRLFNESLEKDPRRQFIYGTGPVLAALQANKRKILALHTKDRREEIPEPISSICKAMKLKVECSVPNAHLNIMTNNGIHNKYVLEVRPLEKRQLVSLGSVWEQIEDNNVDSADSLTNQEIPENAKELESRLGSNKTVQRLPISEVEDGKIVSNLLKLQPNSSKKFPLVLFIDEVTDAHNFGAIIRSAYYLGVDLIVHTEKNTAKLSAVVDKTSAGAMEHIDIFNTPQPLKFFELSRENGWNIIATSVANGDKAGQAAKVQPSELHQLLQVAPCMLVIGSEGQGLRTSLIQRSTHVVKWKGFQDVSKLDSLNVSVATGLLLSKFYDNQAFDATD
ncbi:Mrm1p [Sugiyamaella lignohabitans]|uniref:rRNA methyltransferase 1, mitochondrial n=1 Tax=Sugiyamaella lignohabitans TaxID=796027 RepID=A0A167E2M7_9ASCO|nr:Mrm1p [Sugiyamaella lignohabitans]ANB13569.1 Mrm1p [Sugiyamaella lignohabitans]